MVLGFIAVFLIANDIGRFVTESERNEQLLVCRDGRYCTKEERIGYAEHPEYRSYYQRTGYGRQRMCDFCHQNQDEWKTKTKREIAAPKIGAYNFTTSEFEQFKKSLNVFENTVQKGIASYLHEIPQTLRAGIMQKASELSEKPTKLASILTEIKETETHEFASKPVKRSISDLSDTGLLHLFLPAQRTATAL